MIQASGLGKAFGGTEAIRDVSFTVPAGQVFGLLGPNGAGKTTTLRILATLLAADRGEAQVAGFDVRTRPEEVRRRIGVVNGGMGLYDRLTGRETLQHFGRLYGMREAEIDARIGELDELLSLRDTLSRRCGTFSTGMKQKVVIARAVLHDPVVILFDEATVGLDVMARRAVLDFVRAYPSSGRAVVWSTHVMSEAQELCDRVGILYRGRWIDEGSVAELTARADTPDLERAFFRLVERSDAASESAAREPVA